MERLKKTARGIDIICKILFWILILCITAFVVYLLFTLLADTSVFSDESISLSLTIGRELRLKFPEDTLTGVDIELVYVVFLLVGCAVCGVMIYALRVFQQMLKPMKNGAPFDSTVARGFHKLGWFTIIVGVAVNLLEPIMVNVLIEAIAPMETLSGSGTVLQYEFRLTFIIVALLMFLLSYVFRYGEELQQLSDETL